VRKSIHKDGDFDWLRTTELSFAIRDIRSAQALNASLVLRDCGGAEASRDPCVVEFEDGQQTPIELRELVANGIGLRVPADVALEPYIEIVKAFRPRVRSLIEDVVDTSRTAEGSVETRALQTSIADMNHEVERVKRLRRYMVAEVLAALVRRNPRLIVSALTACATRAGTLLSGIGLPIASAIDRFKSKKGNSSKAGQALRNKIAADLEPYLNKLAATYLRTNEKTMQVISARRHFHKSRLPASGAVIGETALNWWHCH